MQRVIHLLSLSKACERLGIVYLAMGKFDYALEFAEMAWSAVRNRPTVRIFRELRNLSKPATVIFLIFFVKCFPCT